MIKYNSNTINDWNFGDDNIIKVYHNNAVCYYKIVSSGGTSGTFYKSPNATWSTGDSGIPSSWTVQDYQGYYI